jgi:toxin ParE1/3/4
VTRVEIGDRARDDREQIITYTIDRFGEAQALRLGDRLRDALVMLGQSPSVGREAPSIHPTSGSRLRFFTIARRFIVVYEPIDDGIRVVRIIHGARHLSAALAALDEQEP